MDKFKLSISCTICCILIGCIAAPAKQVSKSQNTLNELIIKNGTHSSMLNVTLTDNETNSTVSCNTILAMSDCALGFQAIKLTNHPATVSWSQNGRKYSQALPNDQQPKLGAAKNFKAAVTLLDNGKLELSLD